MTTELSWRGPRGDGYHARDLTCITQYKVRSVGGAGVRSMSATERQCQDWHPTGNEANGRDPHALQRGIHVMEDGDGEPTGIRDHYYLAKGERVAC